MNTPTVNANRITHLVERWSDLQSIAGRGWPDAAMNHITSAIGVVEREVLAAPCQTFGDVSAKLEFVRGWIAANVANERDDAVDMLRQIADEAAEVHRQGG